MFNISKRTMQRRVHEYQLYKEKYNHISDDELEEMVHKIILDFPKSGFWRMKGYLQAKGLNIHWERIHSALWKLDPERMTLRSVNSNIIRWQKHSVPGTLFLWHINGNHKLIRWRFFINVSPRSLNNKASTVLVLYIEAVQNYGLPSKVRAYHGLKIISLSCLQRIVTVAASSQGKAVIFSELSGCAVICLLVVLLFFIACSCFWRKICI